MVIIDQGDDQKVMPDPKYSYEMKISTKFVVFWKGLEELVPDTLLSVAFFFLKSWNKPLLPGSSSNF